MKSGTSEKARELAGHELAISRESHAESPEAIPAKDELLTVVVHELRNTLSPILTWTQLLRSGTLARDKTQRALDAIERGVTAQTKLMDELLDLSRAASGELRMDLRPLDLEPVIRTAAEAQRLASEAKQIQIVADERAGLVSGDSMRIQQVVRELIANAIASTHEGGVVTVVLKRVRAQIELSVSDRGAGMSAIMVEQAFDPYHPDADGSQRGWARLALGLALARHIVRLHGGEIVAHSDGPGLGSSFTLHIPLLTELPPGGKTAPPGDGA